MPGRFVVIGLGVFGRNVALQLVRHGQSVLAVDKDPRLVQEIANELDAAVAVDTTDESALAELGLEEMTCAVVTIGSESTEASILTTALLRQMGVPRIVARATSVLHGRVLRAVGAHEVVNPEEAMGRRLAHHLAQPGLRELVELDEGAEIAEIELPEAWVGRSLSQLDVRRSHRISVVAIRRGGKVLPGVDAAEDLRSGDVLLILGAPEAITELASRA